MNLERGDIVLERFRVVAQHHWTRMAAIFRVTDEDGQSGLLKVLAAGADERRRDRFEREAQLLARFRHPNVVRLLGFGYLEDVLPAIVIEELPGERLDRLLERRGALRWPDAVDIVRGTLEGLAALHAGGVIHREVAPHNIMVGPDGVGRLSGLDLATLREQATARVSWTGDSLGPPHFAAPERALDGLSDERGDVFGAAATLYRTLTGQQPFPGRCTSAVLAAFSRGAPPPLAPAGLPELPPRLGAALLAALEVDPAVRTSTAHRFAELLCQVRRRGERMAPPSPLRLPARSRCVVGGVAPPSGATAPAIAGWMAHRLAGRGRVAALDDETFVALLDPPEETSAPELVECLRAALERRYGPDIRLGWASVEFQTLTRAPRACGVPVPPSVQQLLWHLSG